MDTVEFIVWVVFLLLLAVSIFVSSRRRTKREKEIDELLYGLKSKMEDIHERVCGSSIPPKADPSKKWPDRSGGIHFKK